MTATDPVTERVSHENPVPRIGPRDTAETAEAERILRRVLSSPAGRTRAWPTRLPTPDGVLTTVGVACAIAVAAVALVLVGHARRQSPTTPSAGNATESRQQLLRTFGVLRMAPTAADRRLIACEVQPLRPISGIRQCRGIPPFLFLVPRIPPHTRASRQFQRRLARMGYPKLDPPLLRVVTIPRLTATVTIVPTTFRPSLHSSHRSEGLELTLQLPGSGVTGTGPLPTSAAAMKAHGLALSDGQPVNNSVEGVILVPDGVAKVTLAPFRLISPPAQIAPTEFGTITAAVHDNVAAYRFRIPNGTNRKMWNGIYGVPAEAQATWFDASGNVIRHTTTELDLFITLHGKGPFPGLQRRKGSAFCRQNPAAC